MLTELRVRDLAVIADATLPLRPGLNVLTGETGAGKSMLIDALSLLLGERAQVELVRPGASRAVVEAAFDLDRTTDLVPRAERAGIEVDDGVLVVRRNINAEGRNRAWANGSPTTVAVLSELGRTLVDLHGQHEAQSLLRPQAQRDILDAFGGADAERTAVTVAYERLHDLETREAELRARHDEVMRRADYLRHVVAEIEDLAPTVGEDERLAVEAQRLAHAEELTSLAERLAAQLDGDEAGSARGALSEAARAVDQLARIDASTDRWREPLDNALAILDEVTREVRAYASDVEVDPGRLDEVETRRDKIYRLLQKYGSTVEAVVETGEASRREIELLDTAEFDLARLAEERDAARHDLANATEALSAKRVVAGGALAAKVDAQLPALGLPDGEFQVALTRRDADASYGREDVAFVVRLNRGMEMRPVANVASGGELSRIMLALKVVLAEHDRLPTVVFDEVDQGVGGETGHALGAALAAVAQSRQVLVITHLPQIAARATHHLHVTKTAEDLMATARVRVLDADERVIEIARMLGNADDASLRQHATELIRGSRGVVTPINAA